MDELSAVTEKHKQTTYPARETKRRLTQYWMGDHEAFANREVDLLLSCGVGGAAEQSGPIWDRETDRTAA